MGGRGQGSRKGHNTDTVGRLCLCVSMFTFYLLSFPEKNFLSPLKSALQTPGSLITQ